MTGCLSFAQKQLGLSGISKIKLSGTPATLAPWKDAFAAETGVATEIIDTAKLLSIKGGDWGGYAAIGASARPSVPSEVSIDLATKDRIGEDERQVARDIIVAGAALALFIALVGIYQTLTYSHRAGELNNYIVEPDISAALSGLLADDIEKKMIDMRTQLDRLQKITGAKRITLSAALREIVELMPDNMWLIKVTATNPLNSDKGSLNLILNGRIHGVSGAEEQNMAWNFKQTLINDPSLGKLFDVQMAVQGKEITPEAPGVSLDPEALARKLEERTEFTIELKGKR